MTWSYNSAGLATSRKDQVRLAIGDTVSTDPQLQDEEINQFLAGRTTISGACADCCRAIAANQARNVTQKAGDTQINYSDMSKAYLRMASGFDQQAARGGSGVPYAGGISSMDKQSSEQDTDRVMPQFGFGMQDNLTTPVGPVGNETPNSAPSSSE